MFPPEHPHSHDVMCRVRFYGRERVGTTVSLRFKSLKSVEKGGPHHEGTRPNVIQVFVEIRRKPNLSSDHAAPMTAPDESELEQ